MGMELEVWNRQSSRCDDCGGERVVINGEAVDAGATVAVFWAFLYDHQVGREVFIDATFGTWGVDEDVDDHVTFGSRTGPVDEHPHIASSLVTGAAVAPDDPLIGEKLTREASLVHPRLEEFWMVNDLVLTAIPEVAEHLSGRPRKRGWRWWA